MTCTQTSPQSLTILTARQLTDLLREISDEFTQRTDPDHDDIAALLPVMESLGRSMALLGQSLGTGYARAWAASAVPTPRVSRPDRSADGQRLHRMTMYGIHEDAPGTKWRSLFEATWSGYRAWFASEGLDARADLATCRAALQRHMPELVPTWERLVTLTGDDDLAARMLSLWNPPAFAPGCAQLVLGGPKRLLIRNYDYSPDLFEQVVYSSSFTDRRVIGTGDCLWGLLDGMNDDGLVVSLTFGGRPGSGRGFGISLVVRYLLEVCATVEDARAVLERLPVSMAYNLTISDRSGTTVTAFVSPDSPPEFFDTPLATNHRGLVPEYPELAHELNSVERQDELLRLVQSAPDLERATSAFQGKPLHNTAFSRGFGTLYTAVYLPDEGVVEYHWPTSTWRRSFDSPDGTKDVVLSEPGAA